MKKVRIITHNTVFEKGDIVRIIEEDNWFACKGARCDYLYEGEFEYIKENDNKYLLEFYFDDKKVLQQECVGINHGLEFSFLVSKDIELEVPKGTVYTIVLVNKDYKIPFKQGRNNEDEAILKMKKQIFKIEINT